MRKRYLQPMMPMLSLGYGWYSVRPVPSFGHLGEQLVMLGSYATLMMLPFGLFASVYVRVLLAALKSSRGPVSYRWFIVPMVPASFCLVVFYVSTQRALIEIFPALYFGEEDKLIICGVSTVALWALGMWLLEDSKLVARKVANMMAHQAKKPA